MSRPLTPLTRGFLATFSAVKSLQNPLRADMVAALGEATGEPALRRLREAMRGDKEGRRILAERPLITREAMDLPTLATLPQGTFGEAYASFMGHHDFDPDERQPVRFVEDEELAYVMLRYRQVHDFWHVLCGLPPTVVGEIALKWVEMVQTRLPMCALSATVGPLGLGTEENRTLRNVYIPWALRAGVSVRRESAPHPRPAPAMHATQRTTTHQHQ